MLKKKKRVNQTIAVYDKLVLHTVFSLKLKSVYNNRRD